MERSLREEYEVKEIWTMGETICEIMRPEVDMPLERTGEFTGPFPSGAPAIFADTVAKMGYVSGIIGRVGEDEFGVCIRKRLEEDRVNCSLLSTDPILSTGVAFVSYDRNGERKFIFHMGNSAAGNLSVPKKLPENVGLFHIMGCSLTSSKKMAESILQTMKALYEAGAVITFDPNVRIEILKEIDLMSSVLPILEYSSVFMPGLHELLTIFETDSMDQAIDQVFQYPNIKVLVLKQGKKGAQIITRDSHFDIPICKVRAKDPTGAGDSFDAAFLCGYLSGLPLETCARQASAAAALNTAAFGPMEGIITPGRVSDLIHQNYEVRSI